VIHFYGNAPNQLSGLIQLNVAIPAGVRLGEVPLVVTIASGSNVFHSQAGVTVSMRD
jgi:uncharacterized protein (TIGR03437 family)